MTATKLPTPAELSPKIAWSQRVRKVGGFIQLGFAAFWLVRGGLSITGVTGTALAAAGMVLSSRYSSTPSVSPKQSARVPPAPKPNASNDR